MSANLLYLPGVGYKLTKTNESNNYTVYEICVIIINEGMIIMKNIRIRSILIIITTSLLNTLNQLKPEMMV